MDRFTLTIETGNEAMQDNTDVARALIDVAKRLERDAREDYGVILDANGNRVGTWQFVAGEA